MSTAVADRHYAAAAVNAVGVLLAFLSAAGSLYMVTGLGRRVGVIGLRWSAGRPARHLLAAVAAMAFVVTLTLLWAAQGQFRGW